MICNTTVQSSAKEREPKTDVFALLCWSFDVWDQYIRVCSRLRTSNSRLAEQGKPLVCCLLDALQRRESRSAAAAVARGLGREPQQPDSMFLDPGAPWGSDSTCPLTNVRWCTAALEGRPLSWGTGGGGGGGGGHDSPILADSPRLP